MKPCKTLLLLFSGTLALFLGGTAVGQDNCADAIPIFEGDTPYSTIGATTDGPSPCASMGSDIWFIYTPTLGGDVTMQTCDQADYDTALAAYTLGCPADLGNLITCNDDACPGYRSSITFSVTAGTSYLIQVGGYYGDQGNATLSVNLDAFPPCEPGATLTHSSSNVPDPYFNGLACGNDDSWWRTFDLAAFGVAGDIQITQVEIVVGVSFVGEVTIRVYADDNDEPAPVNELVLLGEESFPVPELVDVQQCLPLTTPIVVPEGVTNLVLEVANTGGQFFSLACNDLPETDDTYLSTFQCGYPEPTTMAAIGIPEAHGIMLAYYQYLPPENDDCADAFEIFDGDTPFSNIAATLDGPQYCAPTEADVWFRYTAPCDGAVTIETCAQTSFNTVLAVFTGTCPADVGNLVACNDNGCGPQSRVVFPATAGEEFLIQVGGYFGEQGEGTLTVFCGPPPPFVCGPGPMLTHSSWNHVESGLFIACGYDDSFWRTFDLATFGVAGDIVIDRVEVGIDFCDAGEITVRLYADADEEPAPEGELTLLGGEVFFVDAFSAGTACFDFADPVEVPAGVTNLVLEVANSGGQVFAAGYNTQPETDDSYISTMMCGIPEPVTLADIGFFGYSVVMHAFYVPLLPDFIRGDVNGDGMVEISDPIYLLDDLFVGGPDPACQEAANVNDDDINDISDVVYLLSFLFGDGPPPLPPFPVCGPDPNPPGVGCEAYICP